MEILKTLQDAGTSLYPEDLDFFETELATGGPYTEAYQKQCMEQIKKLRAWMKGDISEEELRSEQPLKDNGTDPLYGSRWSENAEMPEGITVELSKLAPQESNPAFTSMTPTQAIFHDIGVMRETDTYKADFKKYIASKPEIDADFVDAHFSSFEPWEMEAIVSVIPLPEKFLEKYFTALDADKIARFQLFSEGFYMKHYADFDVNVVMHFGKNPWRKKENRSKQFDVFLRLKGVKI